jgi:thymidylate kinase
MKILILEGIATSGKSTITNKIKEQLGDLSVRVATEEETHIPIMKQTGELHIPFFEDLVKQLVDEKPILIIFDRLYLTQTFRAGVSVGEYSDLESLLSQYDTLTVFLKVDEQTIAERVAKAARHRDPSWGEYIKTKGSNGSEIANYYITQQRSQIDLLNTSNLPHMVYNTTTHDYKKITQQILEKLQLK